MAQPAETPTRTLETSPAQPEMPYDVFVSYSHIDAEWVRGWLVPQLREAGLKVCVDYEAFDIGVPSLTNMERAVAASRHTILALSPAWVSSEWTEFESTLGFALRSQRTLPVLHKPCKLPDRFRMLSYSDLTGAGDSVAEFGKLVDAIRGVRRLSGDPGTSFGSAALVESSSSASGHAARVGKSLDALVELVQGPIVQAKVGEYRASFEAASLQIGVLSDYKNLHDLLHSLQFQCYEPLVTQLRLPADGVLLANVMPYVGVIPDVVEQMKEVIARRRVAEQESTWVRMLDQTGQVFEQAVDYEDTDQLKVVARRLADILSQCPSRINTRLNAAAGALHLASLIKTFEWLREYLIEHGAEGANVQSVADAVPILDRLDSELTELTVAHDRWQLFEEALRRVEAALETQKDMLELEWSFPNLKEQAELLYTGSSERWAVALREASTKLETALAEHNPAGMRSSFGGFRATAGLRFHRVDKELKELCQQLREQIGERLESLLREL